MKDTLISLVEGRPPSAIAEMDDELLNLVEAIARRNPEIIEFEGEANITTLLERIDIERVARSLK